MRTTVKLGLGTIAGAVGAGILALPTAAVADSDDVFWKRDDDRADVVMTVDDRDDDDTNDDDTNGTNGTNGSDTSGVDSNDNTNSRVSAVSRDRDVSQDDRTRDWTRDGGDKTLDQTANGTNDRSRNDTRG